MNGKAVMSFMGMNQSSKTAEDLELEAIDKKLTEELLRVEAMDFSKERRKRLSELKIQSLLEIFSRLPLETEKIENYIVNNYVKPSEITIAVIKHLEQNCFAPIAYDSEDYGYNNALAEKHSNNLYKLIQLLIKYGLDINENFSENEDNFIWALSYVSFNQTAAMVLRLLLENGMEYKAPKDDESIVDFLNFDICYTYQNYADEHFDYDYRMYFFLVLIAFGNVLKNGDCPVKMYNGYKVGYLKYVELLDIAVVPVADGLELHITDRLTDRLVAVY